MSDLFDGWDFGEQTKTERLKEEMREHQPNSRRFKELKHRLDVELWYRWHGGDRAYTPPAAPMCQLRN